MSARGGDRRGARGRARRSRARCPGSRFLALAGQEVGAFFRRPPPRRPSPLPARAPGPPGTSASFPFSPPAPPLLSPLRPGPARPLPAESACPSAGRGFHLSHICLASAITSLARRGALRPPQSAQQPPLLSVSVCLLVFLSFFFLPLCVSVRVPLFVSVSLFPLRSFPPAPRPLLLPVVFSTLCHFLPQSLLSHSLGLDLSASPSVISPTVAFPRVSRVSLSMSIFLRTLLSFPSLPAVSLSLSDALSPQCLSIHLLCLSIIILVSISLPCLAQKLYLCPSLSTASGFPHHPQFRATNSPNPASTSPLPENRCGHGQNLVPVSPDSPLCLWDLNTHK